MKTIGVIGVGAMGRGMVKNLIKAGYRVYACDASEKCREAAKTLGALVSDSALEMSAQVDLLLLSLPSSQAVQTVVQEEDGVLAGLKPGTIICDMSTTDVAVEKANYAAAKAHQIGYLGCPVSGGPVGAENGTMSIMAGGDKQDFDQVESIFQVIGGNVFYLGEIGAGQVVKICHNMVLAVTATALAESFATGAKAGVPAKTLADIYKVSVANSKTLELFGDNLVNGSYDNTIFAFSHMHKDHHLYIKLADELKMPSVVASAAYQLYNSGLSKGYHQKDMTAVAQVIEELANVTIADKKAE